VVVPAVIPLTTPAVVTEATVVLELLHVPPVAVAVREIEAPVHTVVGPVIVPGDAPVFTASIAVSKAEPQLVVEV
jgi:hypothetical protein